MSILFSNIPTALSNGEYMQAIYSSIVGSNIGAFLTPAIGRYVERERTYLSTLSIDHTRQYSEIGYGFSCRFFSMGIFASFLNSDYQDMGCKFTFELFRRW